MKSDEETKERSKRSKKMRQRRNNEETLEDHIEELSDRLEAVERLAMRILQMCAQIKK